jgi:signal transduction histidine kinase
MAFPEFLAGGGEMGERIRAYDWSETPLGAIDTWPQSLRTCVRIMLASRQPIWIGWGKELIKLYNDPYKAIVGGKHPRALGQPASVVWNDIWREIGPMLRMVMDEDQGTYVEAQLLIMERNGYPEETYYTFSYTPIPGDDGRTAGMICFNSEDTERIISERQLKTLTRLAKELNDCREYAEVIERTITTMSENRHDFPFVRYCRFGETPFDAIFEHAAATRKVQIINDIKNELGALSSGAWEVVPDKAMVLPIFQTGERVPYGFLVVGINPYRLPDEKYWDFFTLVADQIANSFAGIHVLESERKKTEALAEIDHAKTIFFSNISHEFRTPLTLLLGPIEDVLNDPETSADNHYRMGVAYRNVLRMQKLVNSLLEFSRIEAGRKDGRFSPTDICTLTRDLASTFRAAVEKAGLQLEVHCADNIDPVYIDTDMWEQIVLNLLANAFKYTKTGAIDVDIRQTEKAVLVTVSDTGVGIPGDQLEKIFDRFHRVENTQGRSQEGTGIGLAMVKELVRLHQGEITVRSTIGVGSAFTVSLPIGKEHLPAEKIVEGRASELRHVASFVAEAEGFVSAHSTLTGNLDGVAYDLPKERYTVLLADDNADMREYVERLLSHRFVVVTAIDGEDAFAKASEYKPDLVLSDVMMPLLDGVGLLKKVRASQALKNIPVIFLSARAGEEAKVEGLEHGVDDYLVKPFSAKELLARVEANIKIARSRITAEQQLRELADSLEDEVKKQTNELRELNLSLQQSNEDLQQFAHVASHDLKEPVRKIRTYGNRLLEEHGGVLPAAARSFLDKIHQATERMVAMIEGVLTYSTLNGGEQTIGLIDLNDTIRNIEVDLEMTIAERKALVKKDALPSIEGAAVLIYQLFYNLLNNALKFVRPGVSPVITITSETFRRDGKEMVTITVADNGIGFEQEHARKIFDTFARLNSKDRFEGTGLGLALCKKIAERHGGSINAEGVMDAGAAFIIQLPVRQTRESI